MRIGAIDPGQKGALAVLDTTACTLAVIDLPQEASTKARMLTSPTALADLLRAAAIDALFLEEVGVRPGEGAVGAFSFGRGAGRCEGVAGALRIPIWPTRPQVWKALTRTPADKKQAVTRAIQLFPTAQSAFAGPRGGMKDGRAEAALLSMYGAMTLRQMPERAVTLVDFPELQLEAT
jgi:crossover junction endodeoxyribonuclease RuvC